MEWFINKQNKIPYYLQLKDLIRYHISTGTFQRNQRLPTVHALAKQLTVNFETVRKAYKELERDGLISTQRGRGSFVIGNAASNMPSQPRGAKTDVTESLRDQIREFLQDGGQPEAIKRMVDQLHAEQVRDEQRRLAIFAECNWFQARQISEVLKGALGHEVRPMLLKDLRFELEKVPRDVKLSGVITTGFHVDEVRRAIGDKRVQIEFVITNMSPETRRKLEAFPKTARFGFICRDAKSRDFYRDMLKSELGVRSEFASCTIAEKAKVKTILDSVEVLLVSPSVYETLREVAPPGLPVFNIQDRVDPMSLKMLKDRTLTLATGTIQDQQN
jgi:GntR family transcriptional regulator